MRRMAALLCTLWLTPAGAPQEIYDLLIQGGHVIDPKNQRNERLDVAVTAGTIRKVARDIPAAHARRVIPARGYYVTPGLIDLHAHLDAAGDASSVNADHNSLRHGVTTAVDAGSSGHDTFEAFKTHVIDHAQTRVLAFLNIAGGGMPGSGKRSGPTAMDAEAAARMARTHPRIIVGIRTGQAQPAIPKSLDLALRAATLSGTVVMVAGVDQDRILERLRPGDLYTHTFGRFTPLLDEQKKVRVSIIQARQRGILFDAGHGDAGFWFRMAAPAIRQGFLPDTISTGLNKSSALLQRATMTNVLSKFLALGMTLEQVIERATVNPATAIRRPDLGTLSEGSEADIALLELRNGEFAFLDSGRARLTAKQELRCVLTVRKGEVVWDSEGLAAGDWRDAGPYTNFR
ncbi:MAG: amidohydrolase/deacetylase family metallohydrolase [Acidobacteria bacterium]|nr:amidohydrolase/deacetylase family metallohydrolase [Acidobacteriota bacterium]